MSDRPKSATVQVGLRLKEGLRAQLEAQARDNGLSLNAEIVRRLERTFTEDSVLGHTDSHGGRAAATGQGFDIQYESPATVAALAPFDIEHLWPQRYCTADSDGEA